jgi:uncharacterized protein (PEP-CTERM system associated)
MPCRGMGTAVFSGLCVIAWAAGPARAETKFSPRVGVEATWTDNVALAGPGTDRNDEYIGKVAPGFQLSHTTQRLKAFLDYELQALFFENESDNNEVFHKGALGAELEAVPDWLYFALAGARDQVVVDPAQPSSVDNLFSVRNIADSTSGRITSSMRHDFRLARLDVNYSRGFVKYDAAQNTDPALTNGNGSDNDDASLFLGSSDQDAKVTWAVGYRHERVKYDDEGQAQFQNQDFKYDRADLELGFGLTRALRLIARGGRESDSPPGTASDGGLDVAVWQGGFSWQPESRNELRMLAGHRFYGASYEALWRRTSRFLTMELSYNEEPTTQTQQRLLRPTPGPDNTTIVQIGPRFGRLTSDAYILKRFSGQIALKGRVTEISLLVDVEKREYTQLADIKDESRSASLLAARQIGPRVRLEVQTSYSSVDLREGDSYDEQRYALRLVRRIGVSANLNLSGNHIERSGVNEYDANWIVLGFGITL